jgi:hypothetical protein
MVQDPDLTYSKYAYDCRRRFVAGDPGTDLNRSVATTPSCGLRGGFSTPRPHAGKAFRFQSPRPLFLRGCGRAFPCHVAHPVPEFRRRAEVQREQVETRRTGERVKGRLSQATRAGGRVVWSVLFVGRCRPSDATSMHLS